MWAILHRIRAETEDKAHSCSNMGDGPTTGRNASRSLLHILDARQLRVRAADLIALCDAVIAARGAAPPRRLALTMLSEHRSPKIWRRWHGPVQHSRHTIFAVGAHRMVDLDALAVARLRWFSREGRNCYPYAYHITYAQQRTDGEYHWRAQSLLFSRVEMRLHLRHVGFTQPCRAILCISSRKCLCGRRSCSRSGSCQS